MHRAAYQALSFSPISWGPAILVPVLMVLLQEAASWSGTVGQRAPERGTPSELTPKCELMHKHFPLSQPQGPQHSSRGRVSSGSGEMRASPMHLSLPSGSKFLA